MSIPCFMAPEFENFWAQWEVTDLKLEFHRALM